MNKDSYDNFMTSFKKKLWDICSKHGIFQNLENEEFNRVKSIFETNIENYKSHILQTNGDSSIINLLIDNIKKEIQNSKQTFETHQDISNKKKERFEHELGKKQHEFNSLLENKKPVDLDFSDGNQDQPLGVDNIEALIQEQLKDRELSIPNANSDINEIVSENQFTKHEQNSEPKIEPKLEVDSIKTDLNSILNENTRLVLEISNLKEHIKSQNDAINKILTSQILILKKLK